MIAGHALRASSPPSDFHVHSKPSAAHQASTVPFSIRANSKAHDQPPAARYQRETINPRRAQRARAAPHSADHRAAPLSDTTSAHPPEQHSQIRYGLNRLYQPADRRPPREPSSFPPIGSHPQLSPYVLVPATN